MQNKTLSTNHLVIGVIGIAFFFYVKSTVKKEVELPKITTPSHPLIATPPIIRTTPIQTNFEKATIILATKINIHSAALIGGNVNPIVGQSVSNAFNELQVLGYDARPDGNKFVLVIDR